MNTIVKERLADQTFSIGDSITIPRYWQVITTENLNEIQVAEVAGLPKKDDSFPGRPDILVTSVTGQKFQTDSKDIWEIVVTYSKNLDSSSDGSNGGRNMNNSRLISMNNSYRAIEKVITEAYKSGDSKPSITVQNSAGTQFADPIVNSFQSVGLSI